MCTQPVATTPATQQPQPVPAISRQDDDEIVIDFTDFAIFCGTSSDSETKPAQSRSVLSEVDTNRFDVGGQLALLLQQGAITQEECEQLLYKEDVAQHLTEKAITATNESTSKAHRRRSLMPMPMPMPLDVSSIFSKVNDSVKEVQSVASDAAKLSCANFENLREVAKAKQDYTASIIGGAITTGRGAIGTISNDPKSALIDAITTSRDVFHTSAAKVQAAIDEQKKRFQDPESEDILPYDDSSDNAAAYRKHEMLIDVHDHWLKGQSQKDVRSLLRQQPRLPRSVAADIILRAGVLPAPTGHQLAILEMAEKHDPADADADTFDCTPAQLRAAQERQVLEVAMGRKRKKTQLLKMEKQTGTLVKLEKKNRRRSSTNRDNLLAIQRKLLALNDVDV